jgi:RNA-dependent RNA polymerase
MFGIIDEYNVLKSHEVFIQYTRLNDYEDNDDMNKGQKTITLDNCKVVITKNPCHHPGDIRTFTAVSHEALKHLKDVVVFSQQGDVPATHQISGSDLDGDEYAVIWHKDLVPIRTPDATPYNYDSQGEPLELDRPVERKDINKTVLDIAESDCLGRLSNLHLAYADCYGVDSDYKPSGDVLSTMGLAGAISEEVDSGKTGVHPLNEMEIRKQSKPLENRRPDFMEKANMKSYPSPYILGMILSIKIHL